MSISLFDHANKAKWATGQLVDEGGTWRDDSEIPFNGNDGESRGVVRLGALTLEDGTQQQTLWTHPKWSPNGSIKGWFPSVKIPEKAVFAAKIGFRRGAFHTDGATFWVYEHRTEGGNRSITPILRVHKRYTGQQNGTITGQTNIDRNRTAIVEK